MLKTMIHEVFHALFFSSSLFDYFSSSLNGDPYKFIDTDGIHKTKGTNILEQVRNHFNYPGLEAGNSKINFNLKFLLKMKEDQVLQEVILKN